LVEVANPAQPYVLLNANQGGGGAHGQPIRAGGRPS
jgi:hypothetical protein